MLWTRLAIGIVGTVVGLLVLAGSALAGGWAVTTIDALPEGGFQAGQMYRLGYTIRQHGQTPFDGAKTAITVTSTGNGERHVFPGRPDGPPGHYVAEVTFPSEGAWDWQVSQDPFAVQTLGTVAVVPSASGAGPTATESLVASETTSLLFGVTVPAALVLAALIGWSLVRLARRRRGASVAPMVRVAE